MLRCKGAEARIGRAFKPPQNHKSVNPDDAQLTINLGFCNKAWLFKARDALCESVSEKVVVKLDVEEVET